MNDEEPCSRQNDWVRVTGAALIWWCVPLGIALAISALILFDAVMLGPHALNSAISFTWVLGLLSFVPETIWGKYRRH